MVYKKNIGNIIPNLKINWKEAPYPVLNERSIRATAWIMFLIGISTFYYTLYTKNYIIMKIIILIFFTDFLIKVLWWPKYSPLSKIWTWIVRKQKPEYVWAIQKRFAWWLWLIMATSMIFIWIIFEIRWMLPIIMCSMCLLFMWMETSLWICVWCKIYYFLIKKNIISEPNIRPACPGWSCNLKK